jgi:uncharacterized membrane protein YfcA
LFSPAFGSYLQAKNWHTLGEPEKAKSSMRWFYATLVLYGLYVFLAGMAAGGTGDEIDKVDALFRVVFFVYLIVWYFASGRKQPKLVKAKYGKDYIRKSWKKPLLVSAGIFVGALAVFFLVGMFFVLVVGAL